MARIKAQTKGLVVDDEPIVSATTTEDNVESEDMPNEVNSTAEDFDTTEDSDININADIIQKSPVKNVRILPRVNHTCVIGGIRYTLVKGVQQNVPLDVKNILTKSDLLSPL